MVVRHIDYDRCIRCGTCHRICPMNVYREFGGLVYIAHPMDCMSCYLCSSDCPTHAIDVNGCRGRDIPLPYSCNPKSESCL